MNMMRKYILGIAALFFVVLGMAISTRARLGTSPISCPPYVLSLMPDASFTFGQYVIYTYAIFILIQLILLGKQFPKQQWMQILVSFLLSTAWLRLTRRRTTRQNTTVI